MRPVILYLVAVPNSVAIRNNLRWDRSQDLSNVVLTLYPKPLPKPCFMRIEQILSRLAKNSVITGNRTKYYW